MRVRVLGAAALTVAACVAVPPALAQDGGTGPTDPSDTPAVSQSPSPSPSVTPPPAPTGTPAPTPAPTETVDPGPVLPDPYDPAAPPPAPLPEELDEAARAAAEQARLEAERVRVTRLALAELDRARLRLADIGVRRDAADAELAAALGAQNSLVAQHGGAITAEGDARRELGNLARLAYTSGPTEWTLIETFLDADNPSDALRRAAVSSLLADRQDAEWDRAVAEVAQIDGALDEAAGRVAVAQAAVGAVRAEYTAADEQVRAIQEAIASGALTGGDGVTAVGKLCGRIGIAQCSPSGWGEGSLTRDAVWLMRVVRQKWPQIDVVGGYRATDPYPDHPSGRAVDVMVPDGGTTAESVAVGDEIAEYFMENADQYGVMYLIWNQRIWMIDKDPIAPVSQWRMMADRGDWTSNHKDHVHITVSTGVSGSDIYSVLRAARASAAR